ncbi:MAG: hypothetical protein GY822_32270 [Deltaproteobacteria bacterium]|nr:hypothetical protein [Deltaproteobacteria bacterium]
MILKWTPILSFALLLSPSSLAHPADHEESLRSLLGIEVDKLAVGEASLPLSSLRISTEEKRTRFRGVSKTTSTLMKSWGHNMKCEHKLC